MQEKILIIDDEKNVAFVISAILEKSGYQSIVLNDSKQAKNFLETENIHAVITDLYMPDITGLEILELCQSMNSTIPVIMITAFGTVETAVSALKKGAFDFITKPFEQTELLNVVTKALSSYALRQKEPIYLSNTPHLNLSHIGMSSIIGKSLEMQEIFKVIQKISHSPSTILIQGESGTGKELVAFEIHKNSGRSQKPFIKINCAAIPTNLIESELFGYEKGAFTGAVGSKPGKFELAHEGTLFLDEVAEMPLEMQAKLLRVLQEHEFERIGGINTIKIDVRIVTATNKDLETEIKAQRFREDLFYRLNVVPIMMPALRERKGDIDLLVAYFVSRFNEKLQKSITGISRDALEAFRKYSWPGNIRQLENILERMMLMTENTILEYNDLPEEIRLSSPISDTTQSESLSFKEIVKRETQTIERELIERALEESAGNITRTAEKLGLSRKGLQIKMKELSIKKSIIDPTKNSLD